MTWTVLKCSSLASTASFSPLTSFSTDAWCGREA